MTAEQLVVGNKYVPFQKTIGDDFSESVFKRENPPFLYYKRQNSSGKHVFAMTMDTAGDYYNPEDVYEYIESTDDADFVLPDKWAIQITPYNVDMLVDWRGFGIVNYDNGFYMLCDIPEGRDASVERGYVSRTLLSGYTAITTEQFKQYVLNQKPTETTTEFVLPEKWAIAVTAENKNELSTWREGNLYDANGYCLSLHRGYWVESLGLRYEDYTLISTELFRKYVLNQIPTDMPTQEQTPQTETKQYPKTPEGLYDMTLDMLNLEKGDIVKVTHKTPGHYMGWSNSWCPDMDAMIGNEYEVSRISDTRYGISLKDHPFNFPPYSLEFVRKGGVEESYHISNTIGRLKYGADAVVKFDQPITELAANDVYWLAKLFVKQNRKSELRLAEL